MLNQTNFYPLNDLFLELNKYPHEKINCLTKNLKSSVINSNKYYKKINNYLKYFFLFSSNFKKVIFTLIFKL